MTRLTPFFVFVCFLLLAFGTVAQDLSQYRWTEIQATGEVKSRHENAFVEFDGKFYLIGGRGIKPVTVFDPETAQWTPLNPPPMEIHHFQPVVYQGAIYILGAMTGKYPKETPLAHIWIYHPDTDQWEKGPMIPEDRRRGGAGVVVYQDQFYVACGIDFGHTSGTNNHFDRYDPATNTWTSLTKAPTIRDHFAALVVNDKLYCMGGRNTSFHTPGKFGAFFRATNPHVDVYDFKTATWYTLAKSLPVPSAAGGVASLGDCIIYFGGESGQPKAHNETYCLNVETNTWTQLAPMAIGRHGSHAVVHEGNIYVAAGSPVRGGGNMGSIEVFAPQEK